MNNIKVPEKGGLIDVLYASFYSLKDYPALFVPKLLSTFVGALWFLGFLKSTSSPLPFLVTMPLLVFMGLFSSVMLSSMVKLKDQSGSFELLKKGLNETVAQTGSLIVSTVVLLVLILLNVAPLTLGLVHFYATSSLVFLTLGAILSALLLLVITFSLYFLPVTLLETEKIGTAFRKSGGFSKTNSREVIFLTLFSFVLLGVAMYFGGSLEKLGSLGFVLGRMVSGVVSTYIFVVSPEYYLN